MSENKNKRLRTNGKEKMIENMKKINLQGEYLCSTTNYRI